eukprot:gene19578-7760_t
MFSSAHGAVTRGVVAATVAWLTLSATEDVARWGLHDPGFVHGPSRELEDDMWDCAEPPKPASLAALNRVGFLPAVGTAAVEEVAGWVAADTEHTTDAA